MFIVFFYIGNYDGAERDQATDKDGDQAAQEQLTELN